MPWLNSAAVLLCLTLLVSQTSPSQAQGQGQGSVRVEAVSVMIQDIDRTLQAIGTLRSNESIVLRPEEPGRIKSVHFQEGQPVQKDQLLIQLDDAILQAELAEAQARLALDRANARRARDLARRGSGTERALDEAEAARKVTAARVELAQARIAQMRLVAPFDGIIGLRQVSVGDYLGSGADIVNLEDISSLKVDFRIPEIYLADVHIGQPLEISVDALRGAKFHGEVYAINPLVDKNGRSIVLRARVPNESLSLRPGLFARVLLLIETTPEAVLVPEESIVPTAEGQFVYRVVGEKVVKTKVKTGMRRDAFVEIIEGLSQGDQVVTAGQLKLRDGASVVVVPGPTSS